MVLTGFCYLQMWLCKNKHRHHFTTKFFLKSINIFCPFMLFWCSTASSCRGQKPLQDTLQPQSFVAISLRNSLGGQDCSISFKSEGLFFFFFFSIVQWKSELETRRQDFLQISFDTSVRRRSILTEALGQHSKLTDSITGDKSRSVFSAEEPHPGHRFWIPQHSVHPKVIKLVWLVSLLLWRENAVGAVYFTRMQSECWLCLKSLHSCAVTQFPAWLRWRILFNLYRTSKKRENFCLWKPLKPGEAEKLKTEHMWTRGCISKADVPMP